MRGTKAKAIRRRVRNFLRQQNHRSVENTHSRQADGSVWLDTTSPKFFTKSYKKFYQQDKRLV